MEVGNIGNFLENDQNLLQNNDIDRERKIVVKQIELENNFYNLFRNTLKILINYDENKEKREEILRIVNDITMSYLEKNRKYKSYFTGTNEYCYKISTYRFNYFRRL